MPRADLDKQPGEVAAMFDAVAGRYDLMNDVLSAGQVRLWRRAVTRILNATHGERILDLAAGTGTSTQAFTALGAKAVACDFSLGMLAEGKRRHDGIAFAAGDALRLPFKNDSFDATTISFGLRNVADTTRALEEMYRVTRPNGRLVVCEFSSITIKPADILYRRYLLDVLPKIATRAARNPEAYTYLAESIQAWPAQPELAKLIEAAGWRAVRWRDLSLGIVAVHVGRKITVKSL
ncbi:MAG TPA: demethylmenaquinone methyltransferase [Streptosporangiaceae bacterium]|nr:demethylmenaquinone methyltransferase [Streptosporangiaceae bacterium]